MRLAVIGALAVLAALLLPDPGAGIPVVTGQQNSAPVITGNATPSVAENTTTVGTYTATDADGDTITWSVNNTTDFEISTGGVLSFKVAPDFEGTTEYSVFVNASDGTEGDDFGVTITVTNVDEPPVVSGFTTVQVNEGNTAVDSYSATDPEGATVTVGALSGADAAKFKIDSDGDLSFKSAPDFENPTDVATAPDEPDNVYEVTVGFSDGTNTGTLDVEVTVANVNEEPKITGLASITVAENTTTTIGTYTATDPEGDTITWVLSGTHDQFFSISNGALSFKKAPNFEGRATYSVTVTARDANANDASIAVTVTLTDVDEPPEINSGTGADPSVHSENENSTSRITYFHIQEPEGEELTDISLAGTDAAFFKLTEDQDGDQELSFKTGADYENPQDADADGVYKFQMTATSGTLTGSLDVEVTVTDVDEAPNAITGPTNPLYGPIASKLVATYGSSDPEGGTLTWSLPAGADKGKFDISSEGALTFKSQPSRTTAGDSGSNFVYDVTVRASDGTKHRQQAVTVRINKPPIITGTFLSGGATTKPIPENSTQDIGTVSARDPEGDTITWGVTGTDAEQVRVSGAYVFDQAYAGFTFVEVPEYELASDSPYWDSDKDRVYVFKVQAFDPYGPTTSGDLSATVTNVDEKPKLSGFGTVTVDEGLTAVGTYTARDPEGATITWSLGGDDAGDFNISSAGALTFKTAPSHSSPADKDTDNVYKVTIRAKDATGSEAKSSELAVAVTVQSTANFRFTGGRATYGYGENGTAALGTFTAADPTSRTISYSLEGTDAGDFSIDSSTGEVTFASTPNFESPADGDTDNTYEFTVKATAGTDAITRAVTVKVVNVNEPITVTGPATVSKPGGAAKKVADYTGSDPEGQVYWGLSGTDAAAFVITGKAGDMGELSFKETPSHSNPADADADNVYKVTVVARDEQAFARNTDSIDVTITVTADQTANVSPVITGGGASHNFAENGTAAVSTYTATDADNDTITWTLEGTDAADFSISTSGVLTFASAPDFESPADDGTDNVYNVTVKASDGTDSDTIAVTVTVTGVDEAPVFSAGARTATYAENGTAAVSTYTAADPEGTAVTYSLEGTDSSAFSISTSGVLTFDSAPDYETKASYAVSVKATAGTKSTTRNVAITISNVNEAPSITGGGATHSHAENDTSTVATYTATDPDAGTTIAWTVEGTDSGSFSISSSGALTFSTAPDFETKTSYAVTVKASDGSLSATLAVTVTVTNVDEPPTLTGTKVHTKTEGTDKSLSTYTAAVPEGATVTWSLTGTDAGDFEISTGGVLAFKNAPDFDNPADADTNNIYLFNVKAADGTGATAKSSTLAVKVTVNGVNEAPTITGGGATHNYAENGTAAVATYTATDPEGTTISWTLEGDDAADFNISASGVLTFASTPDREDADDDNTDNVYEITVKASDGTLSDTLDVEITVTNVNEVPTLSGVTAVTKVENDGKVVTTYTAADPESQTIVWSLSGDDAADFTIPAGVLTFKVVPDADNPHDANTDNVYKVTVKAADGTGANALSATISVDVTVSDTNETPSITGGGASHSYAEEGTAAIATYTATDDDGDTIVWSVSGADASKFEIDSDGVLSFENPPDYEDPGDNGTDNVYNVTVEASDGNTAATLAVTVTVTAVDEPPEIAGSAAITKVEEDGTALTTYTATDPEGVTTITWSLTGTDAGVFDLSTTGVLTFKQVPDYDDPDDADGDNRYEITINAADATPKTGTLAVVVTVSNTNESPVLKGVASYDYDEDRTDAVATFTATDPEGDSIGWTLSGDDASEFEIDDGELTFSTQPNYESPADSDTDNVYEITVEASDGTNTDTLDVTVTVDNVNEAPTITTEPTPSDLEYTAGLTIAVYTFEATDPDANTTLRWTLEGTDRGDFDISSAGVLTFKRIPDYDAPADANQDNIYNITIRAADGTGTTALSDTFDAEVEVKPDPLSGGLEIVGSSDLSYDENQAVEIDVQTYTATNENLPAEAVIEWTLEGPDAALFTITPGSDTHGAALAFESSPDFETRADRNRDGEYELTIKVSSGTGKGSRKITVTVTDVDEEPVVEGPETLEVEENTTTILATYTAKDPEGVDTTLTLQSSGDAADFTLTDAGELRFTPPPDFDAPSDGDTDNVYNITIQGSDETLSGLLEVEVTVSDVNEAPFFTDGSVAYSYAENTTTVVGLFGAQDDDSGDTVALSLAGPDAADFSLASNGEVSFVSSPDFESPADANRDNRYELTVEAADGTNTARQNVAVTVANINEAPVVDGPSAVTVDENSTAAATFAITDPDGTPVRVSLIGADGSRFARSDGAISFITPPDFESPTDAGGVGSDGTYDLELSITDSRHLFSRQLAVTVGDIDEPGALSLSSRQPVVGVALTATLHEPDDVSSRTWEWERSSDQSTWTEITGETSASYTPVAADVGQHLRATVTYTDSAGSGKELSATSASAVVAARANNQAPSFPSNENGARSVSENLGAGGRVGAAVRATDPDASAARATVGAAGDPVTYSLTGTDAASFTIDADTGQIALADGKVLDYETKDAYSLQVVATDSQRATASKSVTIALRDVNEPPVAEDGILGMNEDGSEIVDLFDDASDPDGDTLTFSIATRPRFGSLTIDRTTGEGKYVPRANWYGNDSFVYRVSDGRLSDTGTMVINAHPVNDAPAFDSGPLTRQVSFNAAPESAVDAPVQARDAEGDQIDYALSGSTLFTVDAGTGQIRVAPSSIINELGSTIEVTLTATDNPAPVDTSPVTRLTAQTTVTIEVVAQARPSPAVSVPGGFFGGFAGGGGGGGGDEPTPSVVDFEWTVARDIEELAAGHSAPTGLWSDGNTLLLLDNAAGAGDAVYAYDPASGERQATREFRLDPLNRAPRGIWAGNGIAWVSDSGRDRLFAYDLDSGERSPERDVELVRQNRDPRGIWGGGKAIWVLNANPTLFVYDPESGALLGAYPLDQANSDPRGIWSDGVTLWVSDSAAKRIFAYRLPDPAAAAPVGDPDADPIALERVLAEEFTELGRVGNNSPRGLWSDGEVMFVADGYDGRVYTYNMPDALDTRLAALTLSDVEIGEFSPQRREYRGAGAEGATETTVAAEAMQRSARVVIGPPDSNQRATGHQVALAETNEITVTVTSANGTRTRVYRVALNRTVAQPGDCLRGSVTVGYNLVLHQGGSVEDIESCARDRAVTALYALEAGAYLSYIPGAPAFVNRAFTELFAGGVPALRPLVAASDGPASPGAAADTAAASQPWPECLRGAVAEGFSAVVYEGGSVQDLAACARGRGVAAIHALHQGDWSSYVLGAPAFVNRDFNTLFRGGLPAVTPLIVKSAAPSEASRAEDTAGTDDSGAAETVTRTAVAEPATTEPPTTEPPTTGPPRAGVIANSDGLGVSHRNDCADDARLPRFGWAEGDTVEVLGEGAGRCEDWLWVQADGVTSWVRDEYVASSAGASRSTTLQAAGVIGNAGGAGASHRTDCADDAGGPGSAWADGVAVEVLAGGVGRCTGWLWVRADGVTSWVREQYLLPT